MKQVTYLLGAGASAQSIPIVSATKSALEELILDVEYNFKLLNDNVEKKIWELSEKTENIELFTDALKDLKWLKAILDVFPSFDNAANSYEQSQPQNYTRLKNLLCLFYQIMQSKKGIDSRYQYFIANLLRYSINNNDYKVQLLSWNYDHQFELAYSRIKNIHSYSDVRSRLKVVTKGDFNIDFENSTDFSLVKLNGSAGFIDAEHRNFEPIIDALSTPVDYLYYKSVFRQFYFLSYSRKYSSSIYFSWDVVEIKEKWEKYISNIVSKTSTLVTIGYSFNQDNYNFDKFLFNQMTQLENIIIQCDSIESNHAVENKIKKIRKSQVNVNFEYENHNRFFEAHTN